MNIGRFRRVSTVHNLFTCDTCPIVIRKGVILHDRSRNLQLLSLIVTNRGNVTVDEIEVKVISYDRFGNALREENGEIGQICRFTDSGCLPDQSIGEGEVIVLPSTDAVSCDVMVTRVKTAGNVELIFTDEDYAFDAPEVVEKADMERRNRRIFTALMISLGCAVVLYGLIFVSGWYIENHLIPEKNEQTLNRYLDAKQFDSAILHLTRLGRDEQVEQVILEALEYYIDLGNYDRALEYASRSRKNGLHYETLCRIVDLLQVDGDFDSALEFASGQGSKRLRDRIFSDAVAYYSAQADFRSALSWVALSGNASLGDGVWRDAVAHYNAQGDYVLALEYALKTGDIEVIGSVYDDAILTLMEADDYNQAALLIARCALPDNDRVTAQVKQEAFSSADRNFIRLNVATFWQTMSFAQKQALYAQTVAIDEAIIAVTAARAVITTGKYSLNAYGVVSADIGPDHFAALFGDGTVRAVGDNTYRQCDVSRWTDIIGIAVGDFHTVGLRSDGTVVATGSNEYGQCDVSQWTDVVQVVCGPLFTVGLRSDGTVIAAGRNNAGQCDVEEMSDIILLSAGENHTVGLLYSGKAVAAGVALSAKCALDEWEGVCDIVAGSDHTVGLTRDGTILLAGGSLIDAVAPDWNDIRLIAAGEENVLLVRDSGIACIGRGKVSVSGLDNIKRP